MHQKEQEKLWHRTTDSFLYKGTQHDFRYAYLPSENLLQPLIMFCGKHLLRKYDRKSK